MGFHGKCPEPNGCFFFFNGKIIQYVHGGFSSKPWLIATVEGTSKHTKRHGTAMKNPGTMFYLY